MVELYEAINNVKVVNGNSSLLLGPWNISGSSSETD